MAEEHVHKQEFAIRALSTRSVILYPSRAQIIRDIDEIKLHVRDRTPRATALILAYHLYYSQVQMKSLSMALLQPRTRARSKWRGKALPPSPI